MDEFDLVVFIASNFKDIMLIFDGSTNSIQIFVLCFLPHLLLFNSSKTFVFAFLLQFCHLCRLIRFHIAINFSSPSFSLYLYETNFSADITLLLHQLQTVEEAFQVTKSEGGRKRSFSLFSILFFIASG